MLKKLMEVLNVVDFKKNETLLIYNDTLDAGSSYHWVATYRQREHDLMTISKLD